MRNGSDAGADHVGDAAECGMLERHGFPARKYTRIPHGIGRGSNGGRRHPVALEQGHECARGLAAREVLNDAVHGVHVRDTSVAGREPCVVL